MTPIRPFKREIMRGNGVVGYIYGWPNMKAGDVGEWVEIFGAQRSVQVMRADQSSQGECVIEGCHDPAEGVAADLHSPFGAELSFRSGAIETINDIVRWARPRIVDGDDKPFTAIITVLL